MSKSITSFVFHDRSVRVVMQDGEPWFVATDVAEALSYRDAANASRHLADHQRGTRIVSTLSKSSRGGGKQSVTIINESGLYRLVLRSRKPEAIAFSDWVTGEVLPSIRKTGHYSADPASSLEHAVQGQRYLVTFGEGLKPDFHTVDEDAYVMSPQRFITEATGNLTEAQLQQLIQVAGAELARRAIYQRQRALGRTHAEAARDAEGAIKGGRS